MKTATGCPLKAIPTRYKGYHFRSRLEARWAVFFDALDIQYMYESEGYELRDGTKYLPDFYLPELSGGLHVEVKPTIEPFQFRKAMRFSEQNLSSILLLVGEPAARSYVIYGGDELPCVVSGTECFFEAWSAHFYSKYLPGGSHGDENRLYLGNSDTYDRLKGRFADNSEFIYDSRVRLAIQQSRSARFEFGQSGAT